MIIFWRLMFGHLLSDFTLQSNFINRWKRSNFWGMVAHCATHPLVYAAVTWSYLGDPWLNLGPLHLPGWACIAVIFIAHFIEDQWRVFTIFKFNTPDNTLYFIWDQVVHIVVIFGIVPFGFYSTGALIPEKWPVLGCLFVLATHACTVLIYFIEKDLYDHVFPGFGEKYITMVERLVLALFLLLPGDVWPALVVAWLLFMYYVRAKRIIDLSWLSFYLGGSVAVLCGIAARMVYYA